MAQETAILVVAALAGLAGILAASRRGGGDATDSQALRFNDRLSRRIETLEGHARKLERDYHALVQYVITLRDILARVAPDEPVPPMPTRLTNGGTPPEGLRAVTPIDTARLRHILSTRLTLDELQDMCFDVAPALDCDGYDKAGALARDAIKHLEDRGELGKVAAWLKEKRPDVNV